MAQFSHYVYKPLFSAHPERVTFLPIVERHQGDAAVFAAVVEIDQHKVFDICLRRHVAASFTWVSGNLALKAPSVGTVEENAVVLSSFSVINSI